MPRYIEEMVSQQVRRSEIARQRAQEAGVPHALPVVTISRRMGSGARVIAAKLASELGWSLWDKELIDAMAENADVSRRVVEKFDEHTISELELFARGALGDYESAGFLYPKHLARAVGAIAKLGNAIILGRGANFLLPDALTVRIDARDDMRIRNMMQYENLTHDQAEAKIRESDRERRQFMIRVFGKEKVAAFRYDLEISMNHFSTDDAVAIIKTAVEARFKGLQTAE